MDSEKIKRFMNLAGQSMPSSDVVGSSDQRKLGAQLLLSEVLEYVIKGLGIVPEVNGVRIEDPESLVYHDVGNVPQKLEMVDGLADTAYTMYWNALAFGVRLEEAFDRVCDNNLEKFVIMIDWDGPPRPLERQEWGCGKGVVWPNEVMTVEVLQVDGLNYAVGKDVNGKVRKPSTYTSVDLSSLVS